MDESAALHVTVTFGIGNDRSRNGSNVLETYPHVRQVSALFS